MKEADAYAHEMMAAREDGDANCAEVYWQRGKDLLREATDVYVGGKRKADACAR